ncbi:MAG: hypothetical protein G01um101472_60, partial [Parcubacteria group bacterium Gr01-1014_72]
MNDTVAATLKKLVETGELRFAALLAAKLLPEPKRSEELTGILARYVEEGHLNGARETA